jgi:hypothetical protein
MLFFAARKRRNTPKNMELHFILTKPGKDILANIP